MVNSFYIKYFIFILLFSSCSQKPNPEIKCFENFTLKIFKRKKEKVIDIVQIKLDNFKCFLKWNGKFLNGTLLTKVKEDFKGKKLFFLKDKNIKILKIKIGKIQVKSKDKSNYLIVETDNLNSGTKIKIKFAVKLIKSGNNAFNMYLAKASPLLFITSSLNKFVNHKTSFVLYKKKKFKTLGPSFEKNIDLLDDSKKKLSLKWKESSPFIELFFYDIEPQILDLPNRKLIAFSTEKPNIVLKNLQIISEHYQFSKQKTPYFVFGLKNNDFSPSYNLRFLKAVISKYDVLKMVANEHIPTIIHTKVPVTRIGIVNGLVCSLYKKNKKRIKCLKKIKAKFKHYFIDLDSHLAVTTIKNYNTFLSSRYSLIFSDLIKWENVENKILEHIKKIYTQKFYTIESFFKKFSTKPPAGIEKLLKHGIVKGKVISFFKKNTLTYFKLKNYGDSEWIIPVKYISDKGEWEHNIKLPLPGQTKIIKIPISGKPKDLTLDPNSISFILPFGWTRKGPPLNN
jgi:hypothetical protein